MLPTITDIDIERLIEEIDILASFSDAPAPAVTRILYTSWDILARAYLISRFEAANLQVRVDALGNIFARWEGSDENAAPVGTGSHTDAIPHSGRYDGTVGVLGALEAFRALQRVGFRPRRSLDLLLFTAEEPTRFGIGCLGSRALSGAWSPEQLAALTDTEGTSLDAARHAAGFEGSLESVRLPDGYYHAFVELHIEQGPILERENIAIGAVTAIAAPATLRVQFEGSGGHAGAVLMPERRDALLGGAELALAVEAAVNSTGVPDTVGTTGLFQVHPGAVNSIPRRVVLEIDLRDIDLARRDRVVTEVKSTIEKIAERRGLEFSLQILNADPPATCAAAIVNATQAACERLELTCLPMVSRAYHDSLFMARICPTGMIFIPCKDGISHRPEEYSRPDQIARGVAILAHTLAHLAGGADEKRDANAH
jgi:ureidoglycolate amidohydrolase